jgi:flavin-dependent dehydrogenase
MAITEVRIHPASGKSWIAVGDAALSVDLLSSGGMTFALRSAIAGCAALPGGVPAKYQHHVTAAASGYRLTRARIHGWERRVTQGDFSLPHAA